MTLIGGGYECLVYQISPSRLRKVYFSQEDRDTAYWMQRRLHKHRLAPAVYRRGKSLENGFPAFHYATYPAVRQPFSLSAVIELGQRIWDLGYVFTDPHDDNLGFLYGRIVVVDCGPCSFRPRRKRDPCSYDAWWKKERATLFDEGE